MRAGHSSYKAGAMPGWAGNGRRAGKREPAPIAVIGSGIIGLTTATQLRAAHPEVPVHIIAEGPSQKQPATVLEVRGLLDHF
jgi:threonine dehydrogenase-like Zn-dependent dehydrogenase